MQPFASAALGLIFAVVACCAQAKDDVDTALRLYAAGKHAAAARVAEPLAANGDPTAIYLLGSLYLKGDGVPANTRRGIALIRKAADMGFAQAQHDLALLYGRGEYGIPVDVAQSIVWNRRAAAQGNVESMYNLGIAIMDAKGKARDPREACQWILKAAEKGLPDAQSAVSECYTWPDGLGRQPERAAYWKRQAALSGYKEN